MFKKEELKNLTTEKLKEDAQGLWKQIYVSECFGVNDMILLGWIEQELYRRGYEFKENTQLVIVKS